MKTYEARFADGTTVQVEADGETQAREKAMVKKHGPGVYRGTGLDIKEASGVKNAVG